MPKIRVLVVDDSVVIRKLVTDALKEDSDIEVVGTAANGKIAMQKIPQVNPDIVTLDVEMPEMNGLETVREIRAHYAKLPIVMFSTLTERGAEVTLNALSLGASDYVTKPANVGGVSEGVRRVRDELTPKIRALCRVYEHQADPSAVKPLPKFVAKATPPSGLAPRLSQRIEVVAIGVSTGGPNALAQLIPALPADLGVPVLITQHMPPMFTKFLADRLSAQGKFQVFEGAQDMPIEPGRGYIAPGNFHMEAVRSDGRFKIRLHQGPQENSCRPAVDVMFRSIDALWGAGTLAVILTGMGQDGLRGCQTLGERGAHIIAQDEATSVVWGMPGFVAKAGLANQVLPLAQIAGEITRRVRESRGQVRVQEAAV